MKGHRSARSYGVAWPREGSRQNSRRAPACFLCGISGWRIWRGEGWFRRRDAARPARAAWAVQRLQAVLWRGRRRRRRRFGFNDFRAPALTPFITLYAREGADGQAVVCPLLRGSSATRWVAPKQHQGLRRAFSPAFFGLVLSLSAWVPKNLARRRMVSAGAMLLDRLGPPGL